MNNRIDAIYARQSVDKKDSISIESQIEFCKYELKGGNCKEYKDKGYSGKNTERPQFQQLMRDIESGLVRKVVVYKLDRISLIVALAGAAVAHGICTLGTGDLHHTLCQNGSCKAGAQQIEIGRASCRERV